MISWCLTFLCLHILAARNELCDDVHQEMVKICHPPPVCLHCLYRGSFSFNIPAHMRSLWAVFQRLEQDCCLVILDLQEEVPCISYFEQKYNVLYS